MTLNRKVTITGGNLGHEKGRKSMVRKTKIGFPSSFMFFKLCFIVKVAITALMWT